MVMKKSTRALYAVLGVIVFVIFLFAISIYAQRQWERAEAAESYLERVNQEVDELKTQITALTVLPNGGKPIPAVRPFLLWPIHPDDYRHNSSWIGPRTLPSYGGQYRHHKGLDMVGVENARIRCAADGYVSDVYPAPRQLPKPPQGGEWRGHTTKGGYVEVTHADGFVTRYSHMSEVFPEWFVIGTPIKAGDVIGRQGNTGLSLADHLHFEVKEKGEHINPLIHLIGIK